MSRRWTLVAVLLVLVSFAFGAVAQECVEAPTGMTAWWPGDGNAADIFGAWGGTRVGGASYNAGMVGRAFTFDGDGDYVEISDLSAGDFGADPFTVDFWMYSNNTGIRAYVVGKSNPNVGGAGWDIRLNAQTIQVYGVDGWELNITSDASATADAWHHIALSATTTDVVLYIDGVLKGSSDRTSIPISADSLRFGDNPNYGDSGLSGRIDEVEFFDRALSADDVLAVYNAGSAGKCRPCVALPDDEIAWWRAEDDGSDEVGDNDGTPTGDATWEDGKVGKAFSFDGTGDYILLPDDDLWDFGTGSFSIVSWFKTSTAGPRNLIRYHNGAGNTAWWGVRIETNGKLEFLINTVGGSNPISQLTDGAYADGDWHFVAAVRDAGAGQLRVYVDGAPAASPVSDGGVDIVATAGTVPGIGAGVGGAGTPYEEFAGLIDEVAIFDRALTVDEVEALYNAGTTGACASCTGVPPDVVSWWKAENDASDETGTYDGAAFYGATYGAGLVGQAFYFDGDNDYVNISASGAGDFGADPFTVDFWMNSNNPGVRAYVVGKSNPNAGGAGWDIRLDAETIQVYGVNGWVLNITSDASATAGAWHHIALTATTTDAVLYIDGVLEGSSDRTTIPTSPDALRFGDNPNYGDSGFNGLLDEIELHDRALSRDEISALYNAGAYGKCPFDVVPDAFSFNDLTGISLSSTETSDAITVTGIDVAVPISISSCTGTGCQYSINLGSWVAVAGSVAEGDGVEVRQTSSASYGATTDLNLSIGGVTDTFSLTTLQQFTLNVSLAGQGSGTVTSSPAGINCGSDCDEVFAEGTPVELTATPETGSFSRGFSGDEGCVGGGFNMTGNLSCTATFELEEIFQDGFESGDVSEWTSSVGGL